MLIVPFPSPLDCGLVTEADWLDSRVNIGSGLVRSIFGAFALAWACGVPEVWACEPCALYSASAIHSHSSGELRLGISEEVTAYDPVPGAEENLAPGSELIQRYSTTQLTGAVSVTNRVGFEAAVPWIGRQFEEGSASGQQKRTDSGLGDIALTGHYALAKSQSPSRSWEWSLFAGLKFPTGETNGLERPDNADDLEDDDDSQLHLRNHPASSAGGGRTFSIGTGSYDFPLGSTLFVRTESLFIAAFVQYTIRTEGDFHYTFADDLLWDVGLGGFALVKDACTVAVRGVLSGEQKGSDTVSGSLVNGSAYSVLYLGPEVTLSVGESTLFRIGIDLPVSSNEGDSTVDAEHRLRVAATLRF